MNYPLIMRSSKSTRVSVSGGKAVEVSNAVVLRTASVRSNADNNLINCFFMIYFLSFFYDDMATI